MQADRNAEAQCRTLVVDDDPFTREMVARNLRALGLGDVQTAGTGAEARSVLATSKPRDLIFCDLGMPEEDGVSLLRSLGEATSDQCGIVLISAIRGKLLRVVGELATAHGLWLVGTLQKPLNRHHVQNVLDIWQSGPPERIIQQRPILSVDMMRTAIRSGEIDVYVQPQCSIEDGRLIGVEALSRWRNPDFGLVFPDAFIPFVTSVGLIDELTDHVIANTLDTLRAWDQQGLHLSASVNIATSTLTRVDLPEQIQNACEARNLSIKRLTLEITETGFVDKPTQSLDVISRLFLTGIDIALDDFGTGHATLASLHKLPFSGIKLDRSFVSVMRHDQEARAIVQSTCELAAKLQLHCIAEGVEDFQTLSMLRDFGCTAYQGYWLAPPMPADRFLAWAREEFPNQVTQ